MTTDTKYSIDALINRYNICKNSNLRSTINCPCCGTSLIKNYQRTVFCGSVCKDYYWNQVRSVNKKDYSEKMEQIIKHNSNTIVTNSSLLLDIDKKSKSSNVEVHHGQHTKPNEYAWEIDCDDESDYWD